VLDVLGTIEAAELADGRYLVTAHGALDSRVAHVLHDTVVPLAAADGIPLIVDLRDAHGIDDEILAVIGHAAHVANRRGERVSIVTPSKLIFRLIDETGLGDIVTVFSSLQAALDHD
jgi:anti-anti-sigma factor